MATTNDNWAHYILTSEEFARSVNEKMKLLSMKLSLFRIMAAIAAKQKAWENFRSTNCAPKDRFDNPRYHEWKIAADEYDRAVEEAWELLKNNS